MYVNRRSFTYEILQYDVLVAYRKRRYAVLMLTWHSRDYILSLI